MRWAAGRCRCCRSGADAELKGLRQKGDARAGGAAHGVQLIQSPRTRLEHLREQAELNGNHQPFVREPGKRRVQELLLLRRRRGIERP